MIGRLILAASAALAIGTTHATTDDFVKESIGATQPRQIEVAPDGTPVPSDLTLDADFGTHGLKSIWPPDTTGWTMIEDGMRVFPWIGSVTWPGPPPITLNVHKGYYVVGKQKDTTGTSWRAWIARMDMAGNIDSTFGHGGWIYTIAVDDIVDAAVVGSKAYILGNIRTSAQAIPAALVQCKDLTYTGADPNAGYCFSTGAGILTFGADPAGPRTAAYGQRLTYDERYGIFVAARVINTTRGQEVGIARVNADTGFRIPEFKDDGYNIGLPNWVGATGVEVSVNALAVTPEGYSGIPRLYIAGQVRREMPGDDDGFILGLAPTNGIFTTGWNWKAFYYEDDNTSYKRDAITALAPLRNGKVAFAGWSETDDATVRPMMMGRINNDGSYDDSFCAGNPNADTYSCLVDPPFSTDAPFFAEYKPFSLPVALVERRQNRDLVVAQRFQNSGGTPTQPDDNHVRTLVQQFSANGNRLHAGRTIDFAGVGSNPWSRPFDMWLGGSGTQINGVGLGEELLAVVGTRMYASDDFDATVTHIKSTDSLFADAFGGAYGD